VKNKPQIKLVVLLIALIMLFTMLPMASLANQGYTSIASHDATRQRHTVTFRGNGGTPASTVLLIFDGERASEPSVSRNGWRLVGWYTSQSGGDRWDFNNTIDRNLTLHARWEAEGGTAGSGNIVVTFVGNGGFPANTTRRVQAGRTVSAPNVTRNGHELVGWYTERNGGTRWRFSDAPGNDITLYARWRRTTTTTTSPPTVITTEPPAGTASISAAAAPGLTREAISNAPTGTVPTIRLVGPGNIPLESMQAITTAAQGRTMRINGDSMRGNSVDVRISVNPALATQSVNLAASTSSQSALNTASIFQRHFGGVKTVVSVQQQQTFGMEVRIVAMPDSRLNTNAAALHFYSYDRASNTFRHFVPTNIWVDNIGYLHFNTTMAGDIVITNNRIH